MELEHKFFETNGIRLHVVQAGPKSGIPVLLLHGFPEFWYGWIQRAKGIGINKTIYHLTNEKFTKWLI
jgi:hypothetical protein